MQCDQVGWKSGFEVTGQQGVRGSSHRHRSRCARHPRFAIQAPASQFNQSDARAQSADGLGPSARHSSFRRVKTGQAPGPPFTTNCAHQFQSFQVPTINHQETNTHHPPPPTSIPPRPHHTPPSTMATPTPNSGTATPMDLDPEQVSQSLKVSLADLSAKAAALYAHKKFEDAAEVYAQAAEMQAEMNGEMSPDNAEILFLYGRALFKVGQSKSDVLGNKAPEATKPKPAKKTKTSNGDAEPKAADSAEAKIDEAAAEAVKDKKPLFHFEGDENLEGSDEDEDSDMGEDEDEDDDDDMATAFEILDLARVMYEKKLEAANAEAEADKGKDKETSENGSPNVRHIKERLGDTHALLAEISLENERYPNAITDSRASLKYKKELYPQESEIVAEAHFKLSLALEFASITRSAEDDNNEEGADAASAGNDNNAAGVVDQALRDEAAVELEAAITSTKLKLQSKEVELATLHNPEDNDLTRLSIADVKDIIADMEQRLVDLRKPPIDINEALGMVGPAASKQAAENATDLSGLVRKKRKAEETEGEVEPKKAKDEGSVN
ncbi:hypothetical protein QBC39DRAFT_359480 [Podospora conica]|nr:hypothetical protein QBC39DRAFT_359480 [Schizothecium conicum]